MIQILSAHKHGRTDGALHCSIWDVRAAATMQHLTRISNVTGVRGQYSHRRRRSNQKHVGCQLQVICLIERTQWPAAPRAPPAATLSGPSAASQCTAARLPAARASAAPAPPRSPAAAGQAGVGCAETALCCWQITARSLASFGPAPSPTSWRAAHLHFVHCNHRNRRCQHQQQTLKYGMALYCAASDWAWVPDHASAAV